MAIRQLPFEKGEEFELRSKASRVPSDEVLEHIKEHLEDERTLIVKCGKSFWDVSAWPEIYEAGDEFHAEDLTSIDLKQMEKKEPPKPAFVENILQEPANPLTALYHRTDEEEPEEEPEELVRKTYYLRRKDVEALTILCHETRTEVSAMVREIFERGISSIAEDISYGDIYAEAEANMAKHSSVSKKKAFKRRTR